MRRTRSLARTMGRTALIAGTATAVSGHVAARQQARQDQQMMTAAGRVAAPASVPAAVEPVDVIDQLKRFAELREQGILTEEEFQAQKAKLLSA